MEWARVTTHAGVNKVYYGFCNVVNKFSVRPKHFVSVFIEHHGEKVRMEFS